ncbi:hypothetical protein CC78DRAFT_596799, partial [Lojkania enalia]
ATERLRQRSEITQPHGTGVSARARRVRVFDGLIFFFSLVLGTRKLKGIMARREESGEHGRHKTCIGRIMTYSWLGTYCTGTGQVCGLQSATQEGFRCQLLARQACSSLVELGRAAAKACVRVRCGSISKVRGEAFRTMGAWPAARCKRETGAAASQEPRPASGSASEAVGSGEDRPTRRKSLRFSRIRETSDGLVESAEICTPEAAPARTAQAGPRACGLWNGCVPSNSLDSRLMVWQWQKRISTPPRPPPACLPCMKHVCDTARRETRSASVPQQHSVGGSRVWPPHTGPLCPGASSAGESRGVPAASSPSAAKPSWRMLLAWKYRGHGGHGGDPAGSLWLVARVVHEGRSRGAARQLACYCYCYSAALLLFCSAALLLCCSAARGMRKADKDKGNEHPHDGPTNTPANTDAAFLMPCRTARPGCL